MNGPAFRMRFARSWLRSPIPFVFSLWVWCLPAPIAYAQDEAVVVAIATVLAVEDRRVFDGAVLATTARHPDAVVRRRAALALGRIGDPAGTPLLLDLLDDASSTVRQDAAFGLGLIGDPSAFDQLRQLVLANSDERLASTRVEAVSAIARIGGRDAHTFFEELLSRWVGRVMAGDEAPPSVVRALSEAWRLGPGSHVALLVQYGESVHDPTRLAAVYSLARLRATAAADVFLRAVDDRSPAIRALAVRALTAAYADSAGLDRTGTARWVTPLLDDPDPHVRTNAVRTLGTYADSTFVPAVANRLSDADANVRVQTLVTLGQLGGTEAATLLSHHVEQGPMAQRESALMGLARVVRDQALVRCARWITNESWMIRAAGIEGLSIVGGDTALGWLRELTRDDDGRVVGRALRALVRIDSAAALDDARRLLAHADPIVRSVAIRHISTSPTRSDIAPLVDAYDRSLNDGVRAARVAAVRALGVLAELGFSERVAVEEQFLRRYPSSDDYLVRRAADDAFPAAAAQWGAVTPIETGRSTNDYRDIARRLVLPAEQSGRRPGLVIETERGRISVGLFAGEAPLTVDALLQLADQHYFDGAVWHRVVPNFVIQDGDPRGDGAGGPGFALRDENSRLRYGRGTVGMALSGPDTGGSQFFITHSPQPHLDGTYPVIGQVDEGMDVVDRTTRGDRIRTIRRRS